LPSHRSVWDLLPIVCYSIVWISEIAEHQPAFEFHIIVFVEVKTDVELFENSLVSLVANPFITIRALISAISDRHNEHRHRLAAVTYHR